VETCVKGGTSQHIPMLLATTFLVVGWDAATMRGAAQDQQPVEAAARDANAQAITLDPISVEGGSGRTEGYFTPSTSVATKTKTPLINIPQSLTVVTRDFIKDQGRRRPSQPHAQGSRWHQGLRCNGANRILLGSARYS
jgi:outer membrane receptor protein involved in Fe transport